MEVLVKEESNWNRKRKRSIERKKARKRFRKEIQKKDDEQIKQLNEKLKQFAPQPGTNPLSEFVDKKTQGFVPKTFSELPISSHTLKGLSKAEFVRLTEIQQAALPHALSGRDVLGAAKTGSGKTLAFLIPVLEKLYLAKWTKMDGVGAIIISPTRELAVQTFDVLKNIGHHHTFSAGLIIGGKDVKHEQTLINNMNIIICTPGRLLQHMDQTTGFDCSNVQILVLDEADRILDLGFSAALNAIIKNLPSHSENGRQTLLFSATQTKSVKDIARLSMQNPEYISVHEQSQTSTPHKLIQHVLTCPLDQKINTLYNFIKSHLKLKTIVFLSTCKQVRFVYEAFRRFRPGVPLMAITGKMSQTKRLSIFFDFCKKKMAVLLATDIAARGLDFPAVDWVLQVDCPEDVDTYIHRVGRTARYESAGHALLFLAPSEAKMMDLLQNKKIPIKTIKINPKKSERSIQAQLESLLSKEPELKYLAQKAFVSYMRSIWVQSNKEVFDVHALPAPEFAKSLGLVGTPNIKFAKKTQKKSEREETIKQVQKLLPKEEDEEEEEEEVKETKRTRRQRQLQRKNQDVLSENWDKLREKEEVEEDDILVVKRQNHDLSDVDEDEDESDESSDQEEVQERKEPLKIVYASSSDEEQEEDKVKGKKTQAGTADSDEVSESEEEDRDMFVDQEEDEDDDVAQSLEDQEKLAMEILRSRK